MQGCEKLDQAVMVGAKFQWFSVGALKALPARDFISVAGQKNPSLEMRGQPICEVD